MSETGKIFSESLARLFTNHDAAAGITSGRTLAWSDSLWKDLHELGLPLLMVEEQKGGAGAGTADLFDVLAIAGRHAVPVPVTESVIATWLANQHDLQLPAGATTLAVEWPSSESSLTTTRDGDWLVLNGTLDCVPWGRRCSSLVTLVQDQIVVVEVDTTSATMSIAERNNLADEPSDCVTLTNHRIPASACASAQIDNDGILRIAALGRAAQMCGAMHAVLELTMQYVSDREQFGRPLKKFQAIQHYLARMYCEVVAATTATRGALELPDAAGAPFECAAAIVRTREAATEIAAISHQCHGAIGFTAEYQLGRLTKRLWAWRDEYGDESQWRNALGALVLSDNEASLWQRLTGGSG